MGKLLKLYLLFILLISNYVDKMKEKTKKKEEILFYCAHLYFYKIVIKYFLSASMN